MKITYSDCDGGRCVTRTIEHPDEMKITEKLERAAGLLLTVNARSDFELRPVCKLMKQAHDYILELEAKLEGVSGER